MNKHIIRTFIHSVVLVLMLSVLGSCGKDDTDIGSKTSSISETTSSNVENTTSDDDLLTPGDDTSSEETPVSDATSSTGASSNPVGSSSTSSNVNVGKKQESLFGNLKGTKIRVVVGPVMSQWEKDTFKAIKEKYQFKEIDTVVYSYAEQQQKIPALVLSGDTKNYLDVVTTGPTTLLRYVYGNVLLPIDKYIDRTDPVWKYPGSEKQFMTDMYKVDGATYGVPSYGYQEAYVYYNKTYFKEKRIKDPYTDYYLKNNWNFETFKQIAKEATTMAKDGKTVETYGFATWNYMAFVQAAGNSGIVAAGRGKWNPTMDQPNAMAALDLLYDCHLNNYFTSSISGYTEFLERKTAMLIERPANAMSGNDVYNRMSDQVGMVPMPKWRNSDKAYAATTADGSGVPACSKNVPGAVAFIYEYTKATQERYNQTKGYGYETRKKVISDEHLKIRNEYMKTATINVSLIDGLAGWYSENRTVFFNTMFIDKVKPASAIDRILPLIKDSLTKTVG